MVLVGNVLADLGFPFFVHKQTGGCLRLGEIER